MNINITLFGQMITFAIFVWFTMRYVWPPIMQTLEDRAQKIALGIEDAKQAKETLNAANQEAADIIQQAKTDAEAIIKEAKRSANDLVNVAKTDAQKQHDHIVSRAGEACDRQLAEAKQALMQDITKLAILGSEKILKREVDKKQNGTLVQDFIQEQVDG